ncbi:ethylene-responsive transcription factor-like protein At4g13040 [Chenopodium quinoa]|uniref:AP2/ERF domain-containing protein n=1 Tax=Chenopodium quinoa TaxID=63459 RepID=A0A803KQ28_CHEQI|nr:ethylene-responsive transcription factor-like protein At4g13040 [Chenopodium quinoa]XP_021720092.1 ethylene-responsive transcription factor-like protein At4g13040 [Chenopodium quinoa]
MVSLRRRRLLGLCTGTAENSFLAPFPTLQDENASENATYSSNSGSVYPITFNDMNLRIEERSDPLEEMEPVTANDFGSSKDQHIQPSIIGSNLSKELDTQPTIEIEVKRRKQHRRRRIHSEEQCAMTGVYFKNKKWQAAIKVDKIQIHLGTVRSQEEAAHLYDRAAFMCGREPNFELTEGEKQQLRKLTWPEFLAMTRTAITNKKTRRGRVTGKAAPSFQNSVEGEQGAEGSSASDDANLDS